jgi:hypothetical protein
VNRSGAARASRRPVPLGSPPITDGAGLPAGLAATLQKMEQVALEREEATVYQMALWSDDQRAMPSDFIGSALFASIQEKDADYFDGVEIANANGFAIKFKGKRLTQVHADVWQGIMHLARSAPQGTKVRFKARAFLRLIGRHTGKSQRDQLHRWITDLVATNVEIVDTTKHRRYFGSLLPEGGRDESSPNDAAYVVLINRHLCKLFNAGFATVDWELRRQLGGKWLALWLHFYFSRFTKPVTVDELRRLSGSKARSPRHFREKLREALTQLESVGLLASWTIERPADIVRVEVARHRVDNLDAGAAAAARKPPSLTAPSTPRALPGLQYDVSEAAKVRFRREYPGEEVEACLADWNAWLAKTGRTADRPDGAFLGFAKKWAMRAR